MNWSEIEQNWDEMRAVLPSYWGRLTDQDLEFVNRSRERLIQVLQERYGLTSGDAEAALCEFQREIRRPGAVR